MSRRTLAVVVLLGLLSGLPVLAAGVSLRGTIVRDNGDGDGYADTLETVRLQLVVGNDSRTAIDNVFAHLELFDTDLLCHSQAPLHIGDLMPGESRTTAAAFELRIGDVERGTLDEKLTLEGRVWFTSGRDGEQVGRFRDLILDLDLDPSGGSGLTTFYESFEGGTLGDSTLVPMPIDDALNPPDLNPGDVEAALTASDGYRCQYSDPAYELAVSHGSSQGAVCFPNPTGAPDAFWWSVTDDRGFNGDHALSFGMFLDELRGFTTPTAQLEAVVTEEPIPLAWASTCSITAAICSDDSDCGPEEYCESPHPQLSFKHQVSFIDHRSVSAQGGRGVDRGVVAAQLAGADGLAQGDWIKLEPYLNTYDSQGQSNFFNCSFDPTDDGNDESDFFDPTDPERRFGPSSACFPEFNFVDQGETSLDFDADSLGDAIDGPGLAGATGPGTWVEARFDLDRFRGRSIRLRWLQTGLKLGGALTWENVFNFNPDPRDDGWFIDDVTVEAVLGTPASVTVDIKDNSSLGTGDDLDGDGAVCDNCPLEPNADQSDRDGDGAGDACDACPDDPVDDQDEDGWCCPVDNCCEAYNPGQADGDGDGIGDACDLCPDVVDPEQSDSIHPGGPGDACEDADADSIFDLDDNCPDTPNPSQLDSDADGVGDDCDGCPFHVDPAQLDFDGDGLGDVCDGCPLLAGTTDADGDGVADGCDLCPTVPDPLQQDTDADGHGDLCDNCPAVFNSGQNDADGDGVGDVCDPCPTGDDSTTDDDGLCDGDNCPWDFNPDQADGDGDGLGDACDLCPAGHGADQDDDGVCSISDNCPTVANPEQWPSFLIPLQPPHQPAQFCADGSHLIFDSEGVSLGGQRRLYAVPVDGGPIVEISGSRVTGQGLWFPHDVSPTGCRVLLGSETENAAWELLLAEPGRKEPLSLAPPLPAGKLISSVYFEPSGIFYRDGAVSRDPGLDPQLFQLDEATGVSRRLDRPALMPQRGTFVQSPGEESDPELPVIGQPARAVFLSDAAAGNGRFQLFSTPVGGGPATRLDHLDDPLSTVVRYQTGSPDRHVVFGTGDVASAYPRFLFSVPVSGGTPVALNVPQNPVSTIRGVPDRFRDAVRIRPGGDRVVYRSSDPPSREFWIHSVPITGGTPVPLAPANEFAIDPSGTRVVYIQTDGTALRLAVVPIDGGPVTLLTPDVLPPAAVTQFVISPAADWVYFIVAPPTSTPGSSGFAVPEGTGLPTGTLFRVPLDGGPYEEIDTLVEEVAVSPDGDHLAYYGLGSGRVMDTQTLAIRFVGAANSGILFAPDSRSVAFRTQFGSEERLRIAPLRDDDMDGVLDACDTCPGLAVRTDDLDGDGAGDACDCAPDDASVYPGATEINDGQDNQCPGDPGYGSVDETTGLSGFLDRGRKDRYSWPTQPGSTSWDVVRSSDAAFESCSSTIVAAPFLVDPQLPVVGRVLYYLNRPLTPNPGSWGSDSSGSQRSPDCSP